MPRDVAHGTAEQKTNGKETMKNTEKKSTPK